MPVLQVKWKILLRTYIDSLKIQGDGQTCNDIDECLTDRGGCHRRAICQNTLGGHTCTCIEGFEGNGKKCKDFDECLIDNICADNSFCKNKLGSFVCKCLDGFAKDGSICVDVDECKLNNGGCHFNALCENTIGNDSDLVSFMIQNYSTVKLYLF